MGFLDKLWDETLAGPAPETGLGRFRKYNSMSAVRAPNHPMVNVATRHHDQTVMVTRSITILRSKNNLSVDPGSGSSTPLSGPSSPNFSPGTTRDPDVKRFSRKKPALDPMDMDRAASTSPTVYDWIMIGALDR
ncbi:dormancy-associated protein homolog 4-like [Silene latifolia]|uniref:dormancy-associated protein homolog 4-like n=1 Tax=Silene latifolia TaxID=37657 RepID=UPI003D77E2ED